MKIFPQKDYLIELSVKSSKVIPDLKSQTLPLDQFTVKLNKHPFIGKVENNKFEIKLSKKLYGGLCILSGTLENKKGVLKIRVGKIFKIIFLAIVIFAFSGMLIAIIQKEFEVLFNLILYILIMRYFFLELSFRFISQRGIEKLGEIIKIKKLFNEVKQRYEKNPRIIQYILEFHNLGLNQKIRMDFSSEHKPTEFFELAKLNGYQIYQYIQGENTYAMSIYNLNIQNIEFEELYRTKKNTLFGSHKDTITDLLILPKNDFFYPYEFGSYLYLFTKKQVNKADFENWLNKEFPSRFGDIDESFDGFENLMNEDDYVLVTNYDLQHQFGVIGNENTINLIISKFEKAGLDEFELDKLGSKP